MKNKKLTILVLALSMVFIFTACTTAPESDMAKDEMEQAGDAEASEPMEDSDMSAKSITVYSLDGEPVNLAAEGKPVYIKAWASWCSICLSGLPELDELSAEDTDFVVAAVVSPNNFGEMSEEKFKEWWSGVEYQNVEVYFDNDAELFTELGVRAFPTSAYFDSHGELVQTILGHNDNALIKSTMAEIQ